MESKNNDLIEVLIADSAAFLKNVALQNIARNVYTINEVVGEIKSAAVRQRLAVLPYEISFRVPSCESIHVGKKKISGYEILRTNCCLNFGILIEVSRDFALLITDLPQSSTIIL